eukprot:gene2068-3041_t
MAFSGQTTRQVVGLTWLDGMLHALHTGLVGGGQIGILNRLLAGGESYFSRLFASAFWPQSLYLPPGYLPSLPQPGSSCWATVRHSALPVFAAQLTQQCPLRRMGLIHGSAVQGVRQDGQSITPLYKGAKDLKLLHMTASTQWDWTESPSLTNVSIREQQDIRNGSTGLGFSGASPTDTAAPGPVAGRSANAKHMTGIGNYGTGMPFPSVFGLICGIYDDQILVLVQGCPLLERLIIKDCSGLTFGAMRTVMQGCKRLSHLALCENFGQEEFEENMWWDPTPQLARLDLRHAKHCGVLEHLELSGTGVAASSAQAVGHGCLHLSFLGSAMLHPVTCVCLPFSDNAQKLSDSAITSVGVQHIIGKCSALTHLRLSKCYFEWPFTRSQAYNLSQTLQYLDLESANMSRSLFTFLLSCTSLTCLNLNAGQHVYDLAEASCALDEAGVLLLSGNCPGLLSLYAEGPMDSEYCKEEARELRGHHVTGTALSALANCCPKLSKVLLGNVVVTKGECEQVFSALAKGLSSLTSLCLMWKPLATREALAKPTVQDEDLTCLEPSAKFWDTWSLCTQLPELDDYDPLNDLLVLMSKMRPEIRSVDDCGV